MSAPTRCPTTERSTVRVGFPTAEGTRLTRCCLPANHDGPCDFEWRHPESIRQTWTPPSRRPPAEPQKGRTR